MEKGWYAPTLADTGFNEVTLFEARIRAPEPAAAPPVPCEKNPNIFKLDLWKALPDPVVANNVSSLDGQLRLTVYLTAITREERWKNIARKVFLEIKLEEASPRFIKGIMNRRFLDELRVEIRKEHYSMTVVVGPNPDTSGADPGYFRWQYSDNGLETLRGIVQELILCDPGRHPYRPLALVNMDVDFDYLVDIIRPLVPRFPKMQLVLHNVRVTVFYSRGQKSKLFVVDVSMRMISLYGKNFGPDIWRAIDKDADLLMPSERRKLDSLLRKAPFHLSKEGKFENGLRTVLLSRQPELRDRLIHKEVLHANDLLKSTARELLAEFDQPGKSCENNESLLAFYQGQAFCPPNE